MRLVLIPSELCSDFALRCCRGISFFAGFQNGKRRRMREVVRASVDKGFMYNYCNPQKSSIYEDLEAPLLQEIVWQTAQSNGYEYYGRSTSQGEKSYGHGACTDTLTQTECTDCIVVAASELSAACPSDVGGQTQLRDCRVRIEPYYFHNDG